MMIVLDLITIGIWLSARKNKFDSGEKMEIIDLTYNIEENMSIFDAPWHSKISITQMGRISCEGRETRRICLGTHSGTHMDAPLHFISQGNTIDEIPLSRLIGGVTIVDFSRLQENEVVTRKMLERISISKRMIFNFGWGKNWKKSNFFMGYPFLSYEAAEYLISEKIEVLGMDTPSPDDSRVNVCDPNLERCNDSPIHKLLLKHGIIIIEYLANLNEIEQPEGWNLLALPLKIKGADGAPIRVCIYR